jgi:hypothetical protein
MTPQDIEVLKKIKNDYTVYDGYSPRITKEYDVLNRAIRDLKETVSREVYEHEYELRKNLETEILHLERIINNRWIPVEEALPRQDKRTQNLSEEVQLTVKDDFGIGIDIGYYDYEDKEWHIETIDDAKVIAWMPLPKPYNDNLCDTNPFDNNKFVGVDKMTNKEVRLIDANKLYEEITSYKYIAVEDVLEIIDNQPTINAIKITPNLTNKDFIKKAFPNIEIADVECDGGIVYGYEKSDSIKSIVPLMGFKTNWLKEKYGKEE